MHDSDLTSALEPIYDLIESPEAAMFLYSFGRILDKNYDHFFGSFGWDEDETAKGLADVEKLRAATPRLLAAVEAVLKLADSAKEVRDYSGYETHGRLVGWRGMSPAQVREAITRTLDGRPADV